MKAFTAFIIFVSAAWIGLVVFERAGRWPGLDYWSYSETFVAVTPAIFASVTIGIYFVLSKSIANYHEESRNPIGLNSIIALVIASILSIFIFFLNAKSFTYEYEIGPYKPDQYDWNLMILSGLLGLSVLIFFYWRTAAAIEKEKKEIDQRRSEQEAYLLQQRKTKESYLLQQERARQSYLDATENLFQNPEQSLETLYSKHEFLESSAPPQIALETFIKFINGKNFQKAEQLLDYYDVDTHQLLPAAKALENYENTKKLDLSPQTFKLTLEKDETAYEKLPCNWQKIHTYLAPLEDEIEQADILDTGNIYITDQRVFFVGKKGSETVYLSDIAYIDYKEDALQFFRDEGLSEIFAFPTAHHAVYADLVIRHLLARQS